MREVVRYAAQRNVEVIPEIDVPGHSKGLGAVRPDILCGYVPDTTITNGIDTRNVWCASKESNYQLLDDIIKEVAQIFPSESISEVTRLILIGGVSALIVSAFVARRALL